MDKLIKWLREGTIITGQLLAVNLPQGKTRILWHNVVQSLVWETLLGNIRKPYVSQTGQQASKWVGDRLYVSIMEIYLQHPFCLFQWLKNSYPKLNLYSKNRAFSKNQNIQTNTNQQIKQDKAIVTNDTQWPLYLTPLYGAILS